MRFGILNFAAMLLFAVSVGVAALWVRSYFVQDGVQVTFRSDMFSVYSSAGTLAVVWDQGMPPMPRSVYRIATTPDVLGGSYWTALTSFQAGALPFGGSPAAQAPHWFAAAITAAWPLVRFLRRRRRGAGPAGFPVNTP